MGMRVVVWMDMRVLMAMGMTVAVVRVRMMMSYMPHVVHSQVSCRGLSEILLAVHRKILLGARARCRHLSFGLLLSILPEKYNMQVYIL